MNIFKFISYDFIMNTHTHTHTLTHKNICKLPTHSFIFFIGITYQAIIIIIILCKYLINILFFKTVSNKLNSLFSSIYFKKKNIKLV
jgi:hypothetical protein